ncbi:MAG: D-alanyl-D-alanine carboxypeptidase family protein [Oscillospiraceae bacterium]
MLIIKKFLWGAALFCLLIIPLLTGFAFAAPENSAGAAILVHAETGQLLYEKNASERMLIASTTKIMTALVVIENCELDAPVEVLPAHAAVIGSSMYLKPGGSYTVRDLLYGLLLASGNDAAEALATHCGGGIPEFAALMNEKAAALGMLNSCFKNPHGLDAEGHYSTAADMAILTCAAMKNETFAKIVATKTYTVGEQSYMNHNKLLWNYEGAIGVKTGYTIAAGRILVSCAERNGLRLICVTISDPNDWEDHKALYDWGFGEYQYKPAIPEGRFCEVPLISGEKNSVGVACRGNTRMLLPKNCKLDLEIELPEFVYAGVKAGERAGLLRLRAEGEIIGEYLLVYTEDAPLAEGVKLSPWGRFRRAWYLANKYEFVFKGRPGAI